MPDTIDLSKFACSPEARELASDALDVISEELSRNPSEDELFDAVERHRTENDEANEVILEAAHKMLIFLRGKGPVPR